MKKALVLGANGFVGRYLLEELANNGYETVAAGRHAQVRYDLMEQEQVLELLRRTEPDVIFHLAGQADVRKSWDDPKTTFNVNIIGTTNLLESVRRLEKPCRVLLVGSADQYGRGVQISTGPIGEDFPLHPVTPYAISKCAQEELGRLYTDSYGLDIVMTRSFNHIGVRQSPGFVVPDLVNGLLDVEFRQKQVLCVGNLSAKRDFTDVRDVVRAYRLLIERGAKGEVYNVGSGHLVCIQTILDQLLSMAKCEIPVQQDPSKMRPSDTPAILCDCTKLREQTGWTPSIEIRKSLEDILNYNRNYRRESMMKQPIRYPVAIPSLKGNEKKYVTDCMDTTWISSNGIYVGKFEESFARWLQVKHATSCCNGTVALHLPLLAMGIGPGDEVLVPSFTYIATANAVRYCGATPVFVDCLRDTWNLDPAGMERKITSRTKAVIPVHLYGNPCDMDAIMEIAKTHDLTVLEDAAESHGATYHGKMVGSIGHYGSFSFFGNKIITTGEGGMVVTNDDAAAERMRLFKGQGMSPVKRFWFEQVGYNYRMTNIEAAIGLGQLEKADEHIAARRQVAAWYQEEFRGLEDVLALQKITPGAESVWWMFSIVLTDKARVNRDQLAEILLSEGIETRPLFYPMHIMPVYEDHNAACPVSEEIAAAGLNLPTHSLLKRDDVAEISRCIKKAIL